MEQRELLNKVRLSIPPENESSLKDARKQGRGCLPELQMESVAYLLLIKPKISIIGVI